MACRRPVTSCCAGPGASRLTAASTCSCTARPSRLTPRSLTWRPLALLRDYLRNKDLLLVVDNCEHLASAAARLVADLMRAAPGMRVIATSREPLSVPGEYVVPVPPLGLPGPG